MERENEVRQTNGEKQCAGPQAAQPVSGQSHTPGPWQSHHEFDTEGLCQIIGNIDGPDDGRFHYTRVCIVDDQTTDGACSANIALIASAPELLEALKLADAALSGANMNMAVVERKVRAAIARAEGRS